MKVTPAPLKTRATSWAKNVSMPSICCLASLFSVHFDTQHLKGREEEKYKLFNKWYYCILTICVSLPLLSQISPLVLSCLQHSLSSQPSRSYLLLGLSLSSGCLSDFSCLKEAKCSFYLCFQKKSRHLYESYYSTKVIHKNFFPF